MRRVIVLGRVAISLAAVAAVTVMYSQFLPVNPTTVALTYLAAILLIASFWGIGEATAASLTAVLCFNFFFLPPIGTLTIADPQNWVALIAFLLTAVVASQLSGRARERNLEALARQRDLERLYALSRAMLLSQRASLSPGAMARFVADTFDMPSVGVFDQRTDTVSWAGSGDRPDLNELLRHVARTGVSSAEPSDLVVIAVRLGGTPIGSVALRVVGLSDTVLQSISNLVAIALERARADEATAKAEAARESSELRATVLDALAHEFKTPLTSMKAASSDLLASTSMTARDKELVTIIDEELDRFQGLVTDAVHMLRIDAGDFSLHPGRHLVADIVASTVSQSANRLDGHPVNTRVPEGLTVDADRDLLALALRQLVDNALKYSAPTSTIDISATANGTTRITVHNSGSTIPEQEQARIFERFYRGVDARQMPGTGMGLAIVQRIAVAHGGALTVRSSPVEGTSFTIAFPRTGVDQ
jgi:two-component system sensor histidine kinase KdpD